MSENRWSATKPDKPCACAYEHTDGVYVGRMWLGNSGWLLFRGTKESATMERWVSELNGRWLILEVPPPPKLKTPGEALRELWSGKYFLDDACAEMIAMYQRGELRT